MERKEEEDEEQEEEEEEEEEILIESENKKVEPFLSSNFILCANMTQLSGLYVNYLI